MSENCIVYSLNAQELDVSKKEVLRYLKAAEMTCETEQLIDECIENVRRVASPKSVYIESKVEALNDETIRLDFAELKSCGLAKTLNGCKKVYIFAATLGIELDRLIEKYSKFAQSKATVCHAIGSALIESFCDRVNKELVGEKDATKRFSPGYGDLSLETQPIVLKALDAERKIGIILGETLLMQPSKSVTAIIGIK